MPTKHTNGTTPLLRGNSLSASSKSEIGAHGDEKHWRKRCNSKGVRVHPYNDPIIDNSTHPDITAMSVLSLLEKENEQSCSEMDTNRWVLFCCIESFVSCK